MAFYKAPDGMPGVHVGGAYFPVVDGMIETPDGDYSILASLGFVGVDAPAAHVDVAPEPAPEIVELADPEPAHVDQAE